MFILGLAELFVLPMVSGRWSLAMYFHRMFSIREVVHQKIGMIIKKIGNQ